MKSQDIFILFKLVSLQQQEKELLLAPSSEDRLHFHGWEGWDLEEGDVTSELVRAQSSAFEMSDRYTVRGLSSELGVSKTEVSASIKRSISVGMATHDRKTGYPKANTKALVEFVSYGLKYVFPAKPAEIVRGIPTSFSAPVLEGQLMTSGDTIYVWPDAHGKNKGQAVSPLFKSVPQAVKRDPRLYAFLALLDAIRMGNPREAKLAQGVLEERIRA